MGKSTRNEEYLGRSAAAGFLGCAENTVIRHANAGRLPCIRDSSQKRLFPKSALVEFKKNNVMGNFRAAQ